MHTIYGGMAVKKRGIVEFWNRLQPLRREFGQLEIGVHGAMAGYFIVLSIFPMLVLLLGLLRYTGLSVDAFNAFLEGIIPGALMPSARRLVMSAYQNSSSLVVSVSAFVALWSASRGTYALMRGLNTIYHRSEQRSWLRVRWLSVAYTSLFLGVVILTLVLGVFGTSLVQMLPMSPVLVVLERIVGLRFGVMFLLQTGLFAGMFMALPCGGNGFWPSLPGAMLASGGWLIFSFLYSGYIRIFTGYANVFGSVYAVALSMLWLYICLCIFFFGGAWNARRKGKNKKF